MGVCQLEDARQVPQHSHGKVFLSPTVSEQASPQASKHPSQQATMSQAGSCAEASTQWII